ncbi:MAG: hypothetical protein EU550_03460, partial [Promethearchaeota archaeon]
FAKEQNNTNNSLNNNGFLYPSTTIEGDNIVVNRIDRTFNLDSYGLIQFYDSIEFKNVGDYPITEFHLTHPAKDSDNLISIKAKKSSGNTLMVERNKNLIIIENQTEFELIKIHLDSPLFPQETLEIEIDQIFKNLLEYTRSAQTSQITYEGYIFPLLPYTIEDCTARAIPIESIGLEYYDWGEPGTGEIILYAFADIRFNLNETEIDPFMRNLGIYKDVRITYKSASATKIEVEKLVRDIRISPWGTMKFKESYQIKNKGVINLETISLTIPKQAANIYVYDYLGEILGISREERNLEINLQENRGVLTVNSEIKFNIEYSLPLENFLKVNWMQQSLSINIFTTSLSYLIKEQQTNVFIEGGNNIEYINQEPAQISVSNDALKISYNFEDVTSSDSNQLKITYNLDILSLSFRPIFFIILIAIIGSLSVVFLKTRKEISSQITKKEKIPISEIREFCSLYDERSALILEMRKAEEDMKRRKMPKKRYRNLVDKNKSRIQQIEDEIEPFKEEIKETNETFKNIMNKIDILEAERTTVKDSLNLLDARYKRGKLPSKAAYQKLFDDFKKRQKKVDRSIDKLIQSLRSYLI